MAAPQWAGLLSPATASAYTALAGVLVAALADQAGPDVTIMARGRAAGRAVPMSQRATRSRLSVRYFDDRILLTEITRLGLFPGADDLV